MRVNLVIWNFLCIQLNLNFHFSILLCFCSWLLHFQCCVACNELFVYCIQEPGKIHIVLEYCKGGDLSMFINRRQEKIPEATAKHFMLQLGISQASHLFSPAVLSVLGCYVILLLFNYFFLNKHSFWSESSS